MPKVSPSSNVCPREMGHAFPLEPVAFKKSLCQAILPKPFPHLGLSYNWELPKKCVLWFPLETSQFGFLENDNHISISNSRLEHTSLLRVLVRLVRILKHWVWPAPWVSNRVGQGPLSFMSPPGRLGPFCETQNLGGSGYLGGCLDTTFREVFKEFGEYPKNSQKRVAAEPQVARAPPQELQEPQTTPRPPAAALRSVAG